MKRIPTAKQFRDGLRRADLKDYDHSVLDLFLDAPGNALTATEIGSGLGVAGEGVTQYAHMLLG